MNWHRHDQNDGNAQHKATQSGTPAFVKELKSRHFRRYTPRKMSSRRPFCPLLFVLLFKCFRFKFSGEEVITRLRGQQLTLPYLHSNGFTQPILVEGKDGLGLHVPQENFTVQDVENYVGK